MKHSHQAPIAVLLGLSATVAFAGESNETLCNDSGGTWDVLSCGDYPCGYFPDCDAIVPGCDCGEGYNFVAGMGCMPDPACDNFCPDLNNDQRVDVDDLVGVVLAFGSSGVPADVDGSSLVDVDDLIMVVTHWGPCPA